MVKLFARLLVLALVCSLTPATVLGTVQEQDALIALIGNEQDPEQIEALLKQLEALDQQPELIVEPVVEPKVQPSQSLVVEAQPVLSEEELFIQSLDFIKQKKPWLLDLFMRHQSLIASPGFDSLQQQNLFPWYWQPIAWWKFPGKCKSIIDLYITLTYQFFTMQEPVTTHFAYKIAYSCLQLELLKNDCTRSVILVLALGKKEAAHLVEKMLSIMLSIQTHVMDELLPKKPTLLGAILTGDWLKKITKVIEHPNGMFSLDVAHDLLKNKQFKDLQSMALYALAYTTPNVFAKLLNYFKPALKKELADYVATIGEQKELVPDFLVHFVDNHHDLFAQIATAYPEVLDLLALQLRKMMEPQHRV